MLPIISAYISGLLTLLILDAVMISQMILPTFKKYVGSLLSPDLNIGAAVGFYLLYILVLLLLVILPGHELHKTIYTIAYQSALYGFGAYMTYEFTSMSIMRDWNWIMVLIDTSWGTILTMIIGVVMYMVLNTFS